MLQDKGVLKTWNKDRGFGFIKPDAGGKDIFVHIRDFGNIPRLPAVGDKVLFQLLKDNDGRIKAGNVYIEGLTRIPASSYRKANNSHQQKPSSPVIKFLAAAFIVTCLASVAIFWVNFTTSNNNREKLATEVFNFTCDGRQYCSQMKSCAEAKYFIRHCPNTKMDSDNDGVPCEKQWCD